VLRIGVLLPRTGAGGALGEPLEQAVEMAASQINAAGGVNGAPIELVVADEGDALATATKGVAELVDAHVDAVVGPASSRIALGVLGTFVDRRIVTCSPTASALTLDEFPDDRYFMRTIPSDALQAMAMAEVIEDAGVGSAAVMAPDDEFGRLYVDALTQALSRRGIQTSAEVLYGTTADSYLAAVQEALLPNPGAIALVGNAVNGRQVLATLDELVPKGLPVVINDALRRPAPVDAAPIKAGNADIAGTSPRAMPSSAAPWFATEFAAFVGTDEADAPLSFTANAFDCVSLIAVAAQASARNDATGIQSQLRDVSSGGASCAEFVTCRDFLSEGRNIDLNGASGPLDLDPNLDPTIGLFDRFEFDDSGRDVTVGDLQVSSG
jgi:branched-chain amino acid transport system substrate-binding protein